MFLSKEGKRLHPDNFVARVITPVVKALGFKGGLHAFRHGNATARTLWVCRSKTRMEILGHVNTRTTMGYTHVLFVTEFLKPIAQTLVSGPRHR